MPHKNAPPRVSGATCAGGASRQTWGAKGRADRIRICRVCRRANQQTVSAMDAKPSAEKERSRSRRYVHGAPPCVHAITDISPIANCLRYGRPAPTNRAANPAAKRPNAIHLGCMAKPRRQAPTLLLTRYKPASCHGNTLGRTRGEGRLAPLQSIF